MIDLGAHHLLRLHSWAPDRDLNPQYDGVADVDRFSASIEHLTPDGEPCVGAVTFDSPTASLIAPGHNTWTVTSWEPLTLKPSILCRRCGDHGFITDGRWVVA